MSEKSIESVSYFNKKEINFEFKIRRLKLQENLIKCVGKKSEDYADTIENDDINHLKYTTLVVNLKKQFIDIRDMFEDIKVNTKSENDMFESLDIESVKKDVIDLDLRIKNFKSFMQSQLISLKSQEEELIEQILSLNRRENFVRTVKVKPNSLKNNICSPVKRIIRSPLKCSEVQEFQEFMANSKNRYGGWVLYNHSIFERAWQNFFGTHIMFTEDFEYQDNKFEKSVGFNLFVDEVCRKIPGISSNEVILHNKWYTKYIFLKNRQQRALQKWKTNKQLIKKTHKARNLMELTKPSKIQGDTSGKTNSEHSERDLNSYIEKSCASLRWSSSYMKTTEQWNNKIKMEGEKSLAGNIDVEAIGVFRNGDSLCFNYPNEENNKINQQ